jgi:hypothetical protein
LKNILFYLAKFYFQLQKGRGRGVPLEARCGPEDSRRFGLPDIMTFGM